MLMAGTSNCSVEKCLMCAASPHPSPLAAAVASARRRWRARCAAGLNSLSCRMSEATRYGSSAFAVACCLHIGPVRTRKQYLPVGPRQCRHIQRVVARHRLLQELDRSMCSVRCLGRCARSATSPSARLGRPARPAAREWHNSFSPAFTSNRLFSARNQSGGASTSSASGPGAFSYRNLRQASDRWFNATLVAATDSFASRSRPRYP